MSIKIDSFISELCDLLDGEYYINQGFYTKNDRYFIADLVFWYNHQPFIIIEKKNGHQLNEFELIRTQYELTNYQDYLEVKWFILWVNDGEKIFVRSINDDSFIEFDDQNEVLNKIVANEGLQKKKQLNPFNAQLFIDQLKGLINNLLNDLRNSNEIKLFLDRLKPDDFETENGVIYFKEQIETDFFLSLLTQVEEESLIWRYTSCHSLFLMLRNSSHSLLGINCMNDKSEIDYADKFMKFFISKNKMPFFSTNMNEANRVFIISCCDESKCDDLLMWRLYGKDAKGASIGYALNKDKIDFDTFFVAKVSYANNDSTHKELNLIINMIENRFEGRDFRFRKWAVWKHFFKPHEFNYENEIRLIYYEKEGSKNTQIEWIEDSTNGIISPMKVLPMNEEFPLVLKSVILGPKAQESNINCLQYKAMLDSSNIYNKDCDDVDFSESGIDIYR